MVKLFLDFQRNELDTTIDSGDGKIDSSQTKKCSYACNKYVAIYQIIITYSLNSLHLNNEPGQTKCPGIYMCLEQGHSCFGLSRRLGCSVSDGRVCDHNSAVAGLITEKTSATTLAGKPALFACSLISSSLSAS